MRPSSELSFSTTVQVQHPNRAELVPHDGASSSPITNGHSPPCALRYRVTSSRWEPPQGGRHTRSMRQTSSFERSTIGRKTKQPLMSLCGLSRPIVDLSNDDVWRILLVCRPPWGG